MKVAAIIPARYESTRFPGKPLADVAGKPMIRRIYEQVKLCPDIDEVIVATDDERIRKACEFFGAPVAMTGADCRSGTDRVAQAAGATGAEAVINVQGDQVVLDRAALTEVARGLREGCAMVTVATPASPEELGDPNCVKVVLDTRGFALYFSRSDIPFRRGGKSVETLKHIGIYGFSRGTLERFTRLDPTPLELTESLEQLRALENGIPIRVIIASGSYLEINTPEDRERVLSTWREY